MVINLRTSQGFIERGGGPGIPPPHTKIFSITPCFISTSLLPIVNPYSGINLLSVIIMDNCSIHHVDRVVDLIETAQAKIIFLPPYSPDLMPLEEVFSKVKSTMKVNDRIFQVCSTPRAFLAMAFHYFHFEPEISFFSCS